MKITGWLSIASYLSAVIFVVVVALVCPGISGDPIAGVGFFVLVSMGAIFSEMQNQEVTMYIPFVSDKNVSKEHCEELRRQVEEYRKRILEEEEMEKKQAEM